MAGFDWISLCTDYGYVDGFVAACHGVMARIAPEALGPELDPASLVTLPAPVCRVDGDRMRVEVLTVDHFGNVALAAGTGELGAVGLRRGAAAMLRWPSGAEPVRLGTTFADAPP